MSYVQLIGGTVITAEALGELTESQLSKQQIDALEREHQMPRVTRESLIALAEERGLAAGLTLEQLADKNKGYAGLKALDAQIAALRTKL